MGGYEPSRRFDAWLQETLVHTACDERTERLLEWQQAPAAQAAHPREDHLIPLMVVGGRRERSRRHHLSPEGFCRRAHRIELPFRPRPLISPIIMERRNDQRSLQADRLPQGKLPLLPEGCLFLPESGLASNVESRDFVAGTEQEETMRAELSLRLDKVSFPAAQLKPWPLCHGFKYGVGRSPILL